MTKELPQGWRQQSPIHIRRADTWRVHDSPERLTLDPWRSARVELTWDVHGDHPSYAAKVVGECPKPFMFAGAEVRLETIHFHVGPEHHIEGLDAGGEIHLVHEIVGAPKGSSKLVIGVLVQGTQCAGTERSHLPNPLRLSALLPSSSDWYRYEGSLTTGGHDEIVSWVVMAQPVTLSTDLAAVLRAANHGDRSPQPLQRRFVLRNFD